MTKKLYGSYQNRMMENKQYCEEIKVGTGMTEYSYTDREPYEVIEVKDQKHVTVRQMKATAVDDSMQNKWKIESDESLSTQELAKRGNYWYWVCTVTAKDYEENKNDVQFLIWCANHGITEESFAKRNQVKKYYRANVSFGVASKHYDYEF